MITQSGAPLWIRKLCKSASQGLHFCKPKAAGCHAPRPVFAIIISTDLGTQASGSVFPSGVQGALQAQKGGWPLLRCPQGPLCRLTAGKCTYPAQHRANLARDRLGVQAQASSSGPSLRVPASWHLAQQFIR